MFSIGQSAKQMAIFNSYLSLTEGIPSSNQTWRAGNSTIKMDDFPSRNLHLHGISQLAMFDDTGWYVMIMSLLYFYI